MLKSRPPVPKTPEELERVKNDFIAGKTPNVPESSTSENRTAQDLPWNAPHVRADVKKLFSLRLSEPDMLKLQFINQQTGISMHQFVLNAVMPAIENEVNRLIARKDS